MTIPAPWPLPGYFNESRLVRLERAEREADHARARAVESRLARRRRLLHAVAQDADNARRDLRATIQTDALPSRFTTS